MMSSIYITHEIVEMSELSSIAQQSDWRALAITHLQQHGLKVVNPIDWALPVIPHNVSSVPELETLDKRVKRALDLIDQSDAVLANLHRSNFGTAMEIYHAHRRGKIVTIVGHSPYSPWILSHSQARFDKIEEALEFLIEESQQTDILQWALQFESSLAEKYEDYPPQTETDYQFMGGDIPVLTFAPHASAHFSDDQFYEPEFFTGALVSSLNKYARSHSLLSTYCLPVDPCYYIESPIVRAAGDLIKAGKIGLALIILGTSWQEPSDFIIEAHAPELSNTTCKEFEYEMDISKLCIQLAEKLYGLGEITCRVPEPDVKRLQLFISDTLSIPSIVLRINRRYRMPRLQPESYLHVIARLSEFIKLIGKELDKGTI